MNSYDDAFTLLIIMFAIFCLCGFISNILNIDNNVDIWSIKGSDLVEKDV